MDPTRRARSLRTNSTDAERRLWRALRYRQFTGHKFRRQQPLGRYIVDFVCLERRLVIEVDGAHHAEQRTYDDARDRWLSRQGFRVLRFTDRDVLMTLEPVKEAIWAALASNGPPEHPHPSLPPSRGKGSDTED